MFIFVRCVWHGMFAPLTADRSQCILYLSASPSWFSTNSSNLVHTLRWWWAQRQHGRQSKSTTVSFPRRLFALLWLMWARYTQHSENSNNNSNEYKSNVFDIYCVVLLVAYRANDKHIVSFWFWFFCFRLPLRLTRARCNYAPPECV